jgi:3-hydroxybutyryl-CoA dehydratase
MTARDRTFDELTEGVEARISHTVQDADVDAFARLSGDHNPLHTDRAYAKAHGFPDRVVHGAFLAALVSRFVGMELPGKRCLLLSLKLEFSAPTFPGDTLDITGLIESTHPDSRVVSLKLRITCAAELRARGSALVRLVA